MSIRNSLAALRMFTIVTFVAIACPTYAQTPMPPVLEGEQSDPESSDDAQLEDSTQQVELEDVEFTAQARSDLTLAKSAVDSGMKYLESRRESLQTFSNPDVKESAYDLRQVANIIDGTERRTLEPIESQPRMAPLVAHIKNYFNEAKNALESISFFECAKCVTSESANQSLSIVVDSGTRIKNLESITVRVSVTSVPTDAKAGLYLQGYEKARYDTRTDGDLGRVYRGNYTLKTELEGYKDASDNVDFISHEGDLLECQLSAVAANGKSNCRQKVKGE